MLGKYYSLTYKLDKKSSFNKIAGDGSGLLESGVYNSGLLAEVDEDVGLRLLMPWESFREDVIKDSNDVDKLRPLCPSCNRGRGIDNNDGPFKGFENGNPPH